MTSTTNLLDGLTTDIREAAEDERRRHTTVILGIADGLPYDGRNGYGTVTVQENDRAWNVSWMSPAGPQRQQTELHVFRIHKDEPNQWGGVGTVERHPTHDGLLFDSSDDAHEFAYVNGYLKYFFYRKAVS